MPAVGAVNPNLRVQACAELGLSCKLAQPWRVEPHPRGGGSSGYPVWNREEQLVRDVARCATPTVGADRAAPAASTAPSVCVDLVSRGRGPFAGRPDCQVLQLVPPPPLDT